MSKHVLAKRRHFLLGMFGAAAASFGIARADEEIDDPEDNETDDRLASEKAAKKKAAKKKA